jgi:polysaccharide pyruvyl transferase WcaK-like protein
MKDLVSQFGRRPKVGLIGFFGWGNYGDELFLDQWHRVLDPYFDAQPIHDLMRAPYFSRDPKTVAQEYDAFVIGGGDLVIPNKVSELYWNEAWLAKKVYIAGVGVPTWIKNENPRVLAYMSRFFQHPNVQYIGARDAESAAWIRENLKPGIPVRVHPDIVYSMPLPEPRRYAEDKVLGISVRQRRNQKVDDYSALSAMVEVARERGYAIKVLVLSNGRTGAADLQAAERLPFQPFEVVHSESMEELTAALGGLDVLASMKFHGSLVASMYGVPSIVLSPTTKSKNLYQALGRTDLLSHLNDASMADKLEPAQNRIAPDVIARQVEGAHRGLAELVRQMRLQLDPKSVLPRTVTGIPGAVREFGPDSLMLARRGAAEAAASARSFASRGARRIRRQFTAG